MEGKHNERVTNLLVKSGPGNLNRQDDRNLKECAIVRRRSRARAPRPPQSRKREW